MMITNKINEKFATEVLKPTEDIINETDTYKDLLRDIKKTRKAQ